MSRRTDRIERRGKRINILKLATVLVAALLLSWVAYRLGISGMEAVTKLGRDVRLVKYGTIEDKLSGPAIILNKEKVILAQQEGHFENMVTDNTKVSKGTLLGHYVNSRGKASLRAAESGIFVRYPDGLEEVFNTIDLAAVTPEVFDYKTTRLAADQSVQPGQPIFKIVDSLVPTRLLVRFPQDEVEFDLTAGQKVQVFLDGQELDNASIMEMKQDFGELIMLLQLNSCPQILINQRYVKVEVVFDSETGFLIPPPALVEKDGEKGVYCIIGEFTRFKPVQIIKTKDDVVIVEGLDKNDFILANPPDKI